MTIDYQIGDATDPKEPGQRIIAHIVNDQGVWGKGFVMAVSRRWPQVRDEYIEWAKLPHKRLLFDRTFPPFALGVVQVMAVQCNTVIANMVAQHGIVVSRGIPPIRYDALEECLRFVAYTARQLTASVHMPRIGCGLAGGNWERVEPIIQHTLIRVGVRVFVYDREHDREQT